MKSGEAATDWDRAMRSDEDRAYYEARAEKQLQMATATSDPSACASHYALANLYIDKIATKTRSGATEDNAETA